MFVSLTRWHFILEFHSGDSWSLEVQDYKILYIETIDKTVKLSKRCWRWRCLFDTLTLYSRVWFRGFLKSWIEVQDYKILYIETIDKTVKLSIRCWRGRRRGHNQSLYGRVSDSTDDEKFRPFLTCSDIKRALVSRPIVSEGRWSDVTTKKTQVRPEALGFGTSTLGEVAADLRLRRLKCLSILYGSYSTWTTRGVHARPPSE